MEQNTYLGKKLCHIILMARWNSQWQDVIDWEIATKSYEEGQKDLDQKEKNLDLLIDFCSEIDCNKTKKEMLKKIQPFLKNRI